MEDYYCYDGSDTIARQEEIGGDGGIMTLFFNIRRKTLRKSSAIKKISVTLSSG